ncbi:MAG: AI-2E family transporter [Anaerolineales bacterium]
MTNRPWSLSFRYLMGIIIFLALVWFLSYAHVALEPLVIAAFIAYLINPAVTLLTRHAKLSRRSAVNLVYFTALALLIATPVALTPIFFGQMRGVVRDLLTSLDSAQKMLSNPMDVAGMSLNLAPLADGVTRFRSGFGLPVPDQALLVLESTSRGAVWFLVIIVCVYLLLSKWPAIRQWLIDLAPASYRPEVRDLYQRVRWVWMGYLRGQLLLMFIVGVAFTIAWAIIGIPGAFVLGVIAGLFTLVPDVGPFLAAALAMAVALLEGSSWIRVPNFWVMMIVLAVYLVLISIKNFWLRPVIMGRSVHMNEGVVLVVILIATILNGIMGALLVVPVLASALIIIDYLLKRILNSNSQTPARQTLKKFNRN